MMITHFSLDGGMGVRVFLEKRVFYLGRFSIRTSLFE